MGREGENERITTYLSRGDNQLNLALGGGDELGKLLADAGQDAEAVVLGEGGEEVANGVVGTAGLLLELGDNGRLVVGAEGGSVEDGDELLVLLENGLELRQGLGGRVDGRRLDGRGVLLCSER